MLIAHSINAQGKRHDLVEHLKSVAELAGAFASKVFERWYLAHWENRDENGSSLLLTLYCSERECVDEWVNGRGTKLMH